MRRLISSHFFRCRALDGYLSETKDTILQGILQLKLVKLLSFISVLFWAVNFIVCSKNRIKTEAHFILLLPIAAVKENWLDIILHSRKIVIMNVDRTAFR